MVDSANATYGSGNYLTGATAGVFALPCSRVRRLHVGALFRNPAGTAGGQQRGNRAAARLFGLGRGAHHGDMNSDSDRTPRRRDVRTLKQELPYPYNQDLSKILRGLNRRTSFSRRRLANDPVTAAYLALRS